jgi:hypothetical protein
MKKGVVGAKLVGWLLDRLIDRSCVHSVACTYSQSPCHAPSSIHHDPDKTLQGLKVLGSIQNVVRAYTSKMKEMGGTDGLNGLFAKYQNSDNPRIRQLFERLKPGAEGTADGEDKGSIAKQLQQAIADDIWGGRECMAWHELDSIGLGSAGSRG